MSNIKEDKKESHDSKEVMVVVNGREKTIAKDEISFSEIVALAFDTVPGGGVIFTVTYRRGRGDKPEGTLVDGESVKVKDGTIFNVTATNKS